MLFRICQRTKRLFILFLDEVIFKVREFLRKAPQSGLWMPLGKEVKTMKCWRCGAYGHRTGDRDCPKFLTGSERVENFYKKHEDPMAQVRSLYCYY
jgi:hypothetical protein